MPIIKSQKPLSRSIQILCVVLLSTHISAELHVKSMIQDAAQAMAEHHDTRLDQNYANNGICFSHLEQPECKDDTSAVLRWESSLDALALVEQQQLRDPYGQEEVEPLYNEPARRVDCQPHPDKQDVYLLLQEAIILPVATAIKIDFMRKDFKEIVPRDDVYFYSTEDLTPVLASRSEAEFKSEEAVTVEPGDCRLAKTTQTRTLRRYGADYEITMSGSIILCFEHYLPVLMEEDAEAKCRVISISELLVFIPEERRRGVEVIETGDYVSVGSRMYLDDIKSTYEMLLEECPEQADP